MAVTDTTVVDPAVDTFLSRALIARARPARIHSVGAQTRKFKPNSGTTIKFRRYSNLSNATTPLSEGVTPTGASLSKSDLTAVIQQYGNFITLTDKIRVVLQEPIVQEANNILADNASETIDVLDRDELVGGTNEIMGGGAANRAALATTAHILASAEIRKAVRLLKGFDAKRFTRMIKAGTGIDTTPIAASFWGFVHPDTTFDLQSDSGFTPVEKYSGHGGTHPTEVGKVAEVRFIESSNAKVLLEGGGALTGVQGTTNADVYQTPIFGMDAFGVIPFSSLSTGVISKQPGSAGTSDPLNQRGTLAWKNSSTRKRLVEDWLVRIEHTATA
jgi:N4-gp56 family major capsid protein